jgi:hypothetical protein
MFRFVLSQTFLSLTNNISNNNLFQAQKGAYHDGFTLNLLTSCLRCNFSLFMVKFEDI